MFGDDEESASMRARFLMSPYNLREANKRKPKYYIITAIMFTLLGIAGYFIFTLVRDGFR